MERSLGRFGDLRLEKGGPLFLAVCWRQANPASGFVRLAAIAPGKCGLAGFCAIHV